MLYSKFTTKLSGKPTTVIHVTDEVTTTAQVPMRTHHILLLDRSGSMYYVLDGLIDQVKTVVNLIPKDDLLSIIWYSGPGQYRPVVIGAKADEDIGKELDTLRETVGSTCFSESLEVAKDLVKQKRTLVDQTSITLFTDGQPVVPWGAEEEQKRSMALVHDMLDSGLSAFNCVGYGNYYNRHFLISMSDISDHGVMIHNSRISEFLESFKSSSDSIRNLAKHGIAITHTSDGALYLNAEGAEHLYHTSPLHLNSRSQKTNDFFIINPTDDIVVSDAKDGIDKRTNAVNIKDKTAKDIKDRFFYGLASRLYYYGNRRQALDIITNNVRDKHLANLMINAFTNDEVAVAQKELSSAILNLNYRYTEGKTPPGFVPKGDAFCVMDIFNIFFNSEEPTYYVPFSKHVDAYERIGRKVEDKQNAFTASDIEVLAPLNDFIWNKDKLNLSIAFKIDGTVELNARSASANHLPINYPAHIHRTHTFVKDGSLNIKRAEFQVPTSVYAELCRKGVRFHTESADENSARIILDLSKYPIINRTYVDHANNLDRLHAIVSDITELEAKAKVVNAEIKTVFERIPSLKKISQLSNLTLDQIRVLEEHGISKEGIYGGIQNVTPKVGESDSYEMRVLTFDIAGYATLPSNTEFNEMLAGSKKANGPGQIMIQYHKELGATINLNDTPTTTVRDALLQQQKSIKHLLNLRRNELNLIKMAKILTNDFFPGLTLDDKGIYAYERNNTKMVVKNVRRMEPI